MASDFATIDAGRALRDGKDRLAIQERAVVAARREADALPGPAGRGARARLRQAEADLETAKSILSLAEDVAEQRVAQRKVRQSEAAKAAHTTLADIDRLAREFDRIMADGARVAGDLNAMLDSLAPLASRDEFPQLMSKATLATAVRSSDLGPLMGQAPVNGSSGRTLREHVTTVIRPTINAAIARLRNKEPVQ
jgi:hypothetical protein